MNKFIKKDISLDRDSLGQYIKKNRKKKGVSLEDVSREIDISVKHLKALEDGDYQNLPQGAYAVIFFKKYINFLGIGYKNIVADFDKERQRSQNFDNNIFFNKIPSKYSFLSLPKILKNVLIIAVIITCLFYLFIYFKNIFAPPFLMVYDLDRSQLVGNMIVVEGKSESESEVLINNESVLSDSSGFFSKKVYLKSGLNSIYISAQKKHSKINLITKQILVEEDL